MSDALESQVWAVAGYSLVLPLLLLAASLPLYLMRIAFGWRIGPAELAAEHASRGSRQFAISQLFMITAALAVALALARWWLIVDGDHGTGVRDYGGLVVACLATAILSAFTMIPAVWSVLATKSLWKGWTGLAIYCVAMTLVTMSLVLGVSGVPVPPDEAFAPMLANQAGLMASTVVCLSLARQRGYVLRYNERRRQTTSCGSKTK